jgi:hypothetical protein
MKDHDGPVSGCEQCRVEMPVQIAGALIDYSVERIATGFECSHCGTVWGIVIKPLGGELIDAVLKTKTTEASRSRKRGPERGGEREIPGYH